MVRIFANKFFWTLSVRFINPIRGSLKKILFKKIVTGPAPRWLMVNPLLQVGVHLASKISPFNIPLVVACDNDLVYLACYTALFMFLSILDVFATGIFSVWEQTFLFPHSENPVCKNIQNGKQYEYARDIQVALPISVFLQTGFSLCEYLYLLCSHTENPLYVNTQNGKQPEYSCII